VLLRSLGYQNVSLFFRGHSLHATRACELITPFSVNTAEGHVFRVFTSTYGQSLSGLRRWWALKGIVIDALCTPSEYPISLSHAAPRPRSPTIIALFCFFFEGQSPNAFCRLGLAIGVKQSLLRLGSSQAMPPFPCSRDATPHRLIPSMALFYYFIPDCLRFGQLFHVKSYHSRSQVINLGYQHVLDPAPIS
jgi:hypothetical protein